MKKSTFLLKMKLTFLLMTLAFLQVQAKSYSQQISMSKQNANLEDVFVEIMKQTNSQFIYSPEMLLASRPVSIDLTNATLEEALEMCFEDQPLTYVIENNTVIVKMKELPPPPVKGVVFDENGKPFAFVTVMVKGTTTGTYTDDKGNFTINAAKGSTLVFSFVGYQSVEIVVGDEPINVTLKGSTNLLDEIQVIAYGTTTKRFNTSNISSIKGDVLEKQALNTDFVQGLQGRLPGVMVRSSSSNGGIGNSPVFNIRGVNSLTSGTKPLILLDGVVISQEKLETSGLGAFVGNHNALSSIDPSEISSIEVLKDADATAIYGSRGANGVMLITSKRPQTGKLKVNVETSTGINTITKFAEMASLEEYLAVRKEAFALAGVTPNTTNAPDLTVFSQTKGTDYAKWEFGNTGKVSSIRTSMTGGDKNFNFIISGSYSDTRDVQNKVFDPMCKKTMLRGEIRHQSERFEIAYRSMFLYEYLKPGNGSNQATGGIAFRLPPNFPLFDANGNYTPSQTVGGNIRWRNPMWASLTTQWAKTWGYMTSTDMSYKIIKGLTFKLSASFNLQTNQGYSSQPAASVNPAVDYYLTPGITTNSNTRYQSWNVEPQLHYNTNISKFKIDALFGSTWTNNRTRNEKVILGKYSTEALFESWGAANDKTLSTAIKEYKFRSWFGRVSTNWDKKYILNLTARADGSTRLSPDNPWARFWSIGGAWIFSEEKAIKNTLPFLSFGKLRASFGYTGNDQIPDYAYMDLYQAELNSYTPVNYQNITGLIASSLPNNNLRWESTQKFETGIELGFLQNKLSTTISYFKNLSTDLLQSITLPGQSGFGTQIQNFPGKVQNEGLEIEINSDNITKNNFSWKTYFNISFIENKLVSYPGLEGSSFANTYVVGKPLNMKRTYVLAGIDPATGIPIRADLNGNGTNTDYPGDYKYLGPIDPVAFGGIGNTFTYKSISLDVFFSFSKELLSEDAYYSDPPGLGSNFPKSIIGNYWQKPGDVKRFPKLITTSNSDVSYGYLGDASMFHNTLWFRFKNVNLTYDLPKSLISKIKFNRIYLFARGQNLLSITPGFKSTKDPETGLLGSAPPLRTVLFGINLSF